MSAAGKQVAVVVGATSKWQADGRNTKLAHGKAIDDRDLPVGIRWGVGGAIAQKFAKEGFFVVLTTRHAANAAALEKAIVEQGGESMIVELDLVSRESISRAFATIRTDAGDPDVLVYNAGYLEGRDLPHIFDRFYRSDQAVKQTKGAGLGLYLARAIVEAHGGRIWADPKAATGATLCFSLPR